MKTFKLPMLALLSVLAGALVLGSQPHDSSVGTEKSSDAVQPTSGTEAKKDSAGQYAAVNGLKMYYEVHGAGRPLVLLHGAFGWATVYPALAKNRRVIAVELQGHGHTAD